MFAEINLPDVKFPVKKTSNGYDKWNSIKFFSIKNHKTELIKFSIRPNDKAPMMKAFQLLEKSKLALVQDNCNVGLLTGIKSDITVVDIDLYKMSMDNAFLKKFSSELKFNFGTFAVNTAGGGKHFYFKYDSDIRQTQDKGAKGFCVDIRNDGGYVVCPPSCINGKSYTICNDVQLIEIPKKLKDWLLDNLYDKNKIIDDEKDSNNNDNIDKTIDINTTYDIDISDEDFELILDKLPVETEKPKKKDMEAKKAADMRGSRYNWLNILKACKFIGKKDKFIEWSKGTVYGNYNEDSVMKEWNNADARIYNFQKMCDIAGVENRFIYKKVPENNFNNYKQIKQSKLDTYHYVKDPKTGKDTKEIKSKELFFNRPIYDKNNKVIDNPNFLLKSDPGTGKTSAFRNYVETIDSPFISITSRVSLCDDQVKDLAGSVEVHHYESKTYRFGDNIIITPESSVHISNYDFSNYVIFMDEFDSIVYHVVTSSTVKNRKEVFRTLINMLATCKQFICVDADISYISKYFLDILMVNYNFYINIARNYSDVKVNIIYDEGVFFDLVRETETYILASDGKNDTELSAVLLEIKDDEMLVITSATPKGYDIDKKPKVLMSPAVLYGVDSKNRRHVFAHYNGKTINPAQMVQQICRCRDIVEVNIFYSDIKSRIPSYDSIDRLNYKYEGRLLVNFETEIYENVDNGELSESVTYFDDNEKVIRPCNNPITHDMITNVYNDLYKMIEYRDDCYNSNKFLHLLRILREKGFIVTNNYEKVKKLDNKELKDKLKNIKDENFNVTDQSVEDIIVINKYLKIPNDKITENKELFLNESKLIKHFNTSLYFLSDKRDNLLNLAAKDEFNIVKCKDINMKLGLLDKMLATLNLQKDKLDTFIPSAETAEKTQLKDTGPIRKLYTDMFRIRKKNLDMNSELGMYKEICNIYNMLFEVTSKKEIKPKINNEEVRFTQYSIDSKKLEKHKELYNYRHKPANVEIIEDEKKEIRKQDKRIIPKSVKQKSNEKKTDLQNLKNESVKVRRPKGFIFENLMK